ncbi:MAG TPA: tripartite tricarboxylate transporter substrate-binding protein [Burkholderiales bacterium]
MTRFTRYAAGIALAAVSAFAHAQQWPTKQVRFIMPMPPGTAPDIIARLVSERLSKEWGNQVLTDNRPGANGAIGMQAAAKAPADGYTFVFAPAFAFTTVPLTMKNVGYDVERDFAPVARVGGTPMLIAANAKFPPSTLSEVLQAARAQPGKINFANPQYGSLPYLTIEMLNQLAGISFYNVAFGGTIPAMTSTISGDTALVVDGITPLLPHVKSGKLKAIAITSPEILPGLESIPLAKDSVPGLKVMGWFGIAAPKATPAAIVQRMNSDVNKALAEPALVERLRELGVYPMPGTVEDFAKFVADEQRRFAKVVKEAKIEPQ